MGWAPAMHDSGVLMETVGDSVLSASLPQPVDPRLPCLQDVKLFFGVHVEGAVEGVKEREKTSDEGYVQRHQVRVTIWVCA